MHTLKLLGAGFFLLTVFLLAGLWTVGAQPRVTVWSTGLFIPVWFVAAALNMWVGVRRAGYSVAEEAPIFLVVFGVPALAAALLCWHYAGG
ncbi:MAG: hypothetical protein JSR59_13765 [Proteobacteria bacterium]|nr:hypothetical protein [Pseudomonadota bacterium]